jgi:hypothetical protein
MRRAALLVSALVVLGCSSDNSDPLTLPITDTNVVGNYALTSSNGRSLPYTVLLTADEQWVITSDQFVIAADNTWSETTNYLITALSTGGTRTSSTQASGGYAISSGQINFTMTTGGTKSFIGSVTGSILSLLFDGGHFLYSKS